MSVTKPILLDDTGKEIRDAIIRVAEATGQGTLTWDRVRNNVRDGYGATLYPVGSQFKTNHTVYGDIIWDVVGHDQVDSATGKPHTMTLLAHNCIANVQFDAPEATYYCATALTAGTYTFTHEGTALQFTLTQNVPIHGQLRWDWEYWGGQPKTNSHIISYSSSTSTSAIETVSVSEGSSGTSLGTTGVGLNHCQRSSYGSNNYKESAIRQFLNSDATAGNYWMPQTKYDRPPSWNASLVGFKNGLPSEFLDVVDFATVKCSTNNVYESDDSTTTKGGTYTVADEFWLASRFEVYGSSDIVDGSKLMTYYVGADNVDRIKLLSGSARYWWLRTPYSGYATRVRGVNTDGSLDYYFNYGSYGCVPACIIA